MLYIKTKDAISVISKLGVSLSKGELAKAQSRAINRSLEKGRTTARTEVKKVYNIANKYLKGIDYKRANTNTLKGELYADRKPIPLDAFSPKQETGSRIISITKRGEQRVKQLRRTKSNPTAGVSIEVIKGQSKTIPYAFMIIGGKPRIFARGEYAQGMQYGFIQRHHRVNKGSDTPVKPLITLSVFGGIINDKVIGNIGKQVKAFYPQRLVHEIEFIIKKNNSTTANA